MERITKILRHQKYIQYLKKNQEAEKERFFCCHDLGHAVDVARVAYILVLEEQLDIPKCIVYAAALLHDIGRWKEYADGVDHATESALLAEDILRDIGFDNEERTMIVKAIREHRQEGNQSTNFSRVLYQSDKISRPCMECSVIEQCKRFGAGKLPELKY